MNSLLKQRPNHYDVLGLTPAASGEEIRQAFAREMSPLRPRTVGSIAELAVAVETLRDPLKRRAYDASIGVVPAPALPKPVQGWQYLGPVRVSRPGATATDSPAARARSEQRAQPRPPLEAVPETALSPVNSRSSGKPERSQQGLAESQPRVSPPPHRVPALSMPVGGRPLVLEEDTGEWKRPAVVLGTTLLTVAVLGVLAGLWSSRDVQSKEPEAPVNITRADDSHAEARTGIVAEMAPQAPKAQRAPTFAEPRSMQRRVPEAKSVVAMEQKKAEEVPEISSEPVTALTSGTGDALAKMPLSMSAIASTLRRIGYACGEVASTSAVEAAIGVFKVTCTSGQSFRATPVHGRYRFRRWAG